MSVRRATYLDASAIVKLAIEEPESAALRRYMRRRLPRVSSSIARTEVARAMLQHGPQALRRGQEFLAGMELIRVNDRVLIAAGGLLPPELRSLDAIHLATAQQLGPALALFVTYDDRMATAARDMGWRVVAPA
jgi:predicted nucleic acid-binding protein